MAKRPGGMCGSLCGPRARGMLFLPALMAVVIGGGGTAASAEDPLDTSLPSAVAEEEESLYGLNLRGYWSLNSGHLEEAEALFNQVLVRQPTDLPANLNLALVEMRTNRLSQARARLARMRQLYPGDPRITPFLENLR
ncbi:MAG: tetratricopeptide repeat protein [Magnetococcales bacterium]|nr:tetratricopeptide repeat protein [Magnetococcales bacterium]